MKTIGLVGACVLAMGLLAVAAEEPKAVGAKRAYAVTCTASQADDVVTVNTKIQERPSGGKPSVLSAPTVTLRDGTRATITVGQKNAAHAKEGQSADDITDGLRVEIVKAVGQDQVIVLVTVLEAGKIVHAEAQTAAIQR
ncbi:MAG: hypothetical protein BWX88_01850 [Planctomycetes bacterium ADurb.Bin126]|nr:MAG: hypothetical protein BWX88_01850 [Planctomycetes bacterium ADurb.Bin126]HOD81667.1 hypothetical protein [Phycisphaerae bacterium]HQL74799.1 hypothetical protein [Phycisphaerae bacterium]